MDHLPTLVSEARDAIQAAQSVAALDELRVRYLGKKGEVTALLKGLGKLSAEERPAAGERINQAKQTRANEIDAKRQ
ncbi:MAG TPA: phenylalanine--tRNA ligase subunit alpha, partial [Halomonas sp.]|nr:phenylalanine--tRNA ligase subunit alpha [Halomonas sp.]